MKQYRDNEWIRLLLHDYASRHFVRADGSYDMTPNTDIITRLTQEKYGLILDGRKKTFGDNFLLLPFDFLCAKSYKTGIVSKTENTLTIHHFAGSWLADDFKKHSEVFKEYYDKLSLIPIDFLRIKLTAAIACYKLEGWRGVWSKIVKK